MAQYTQYSGYDSQYRGGGGDEDYDEQNRVQASNFGVARPMVDPEADGEVDLNL